MKNRRAFTLIELLVVVAIISLLIAILLPSLSKARKRARNSLCMTNERYLVMSYRLYFTDQGNVLHSTGHGGSGAWDYQLLGQGPNPSGSPMSPTDYYTNNGRGGTLDKPRWCPETTSVRRSPTDRSVGTSGLCWDCRVGPGGGSTGSYGMNNWIYIANSYPSGVGVVTSQFYNIKTANGESGIPVFADSAWHDFLPQVSDKPQYSLTNPDGRPEDQNLADLILNRHDKAVNVSFWDAHVELVPLQNLTLIKWHTAWANTTPFNSSFLNAALNATQGQ